MARAFRIDTEEGPAFRWGDDGEPFGYDEFDAESTMAALVKAVNVGVERGDDIEGDLEPDIARLIKASGDVVWDDEKGYRDLESDLNDCLQDLLTPLPDPLLHVGVGKCYGDCGCAQPCSSIYVADISLDNSECLVCYWGTDGQTTYFVAPFTLDDANEPTLSAREAWKEVEQNTLSFVEKAGRVLSGANTNRVQAAITELQDALASAAPKSPPADESTTKALDSDEAGEEGVYIVTKARDEDRYTMGPYYSPNRKDAHGEMIDPDVLQKAIWDYVRTSSSEGRRINDQHNDTGDATTGEWVEVMAWPREETWDLIQADGTTKSVTLPAGTVYMGIVWDEPEWKEIKAGRKTGLSMGGRAMRVEYTGDALDHMGWKHAAKKPAPHEYDGGKDGSGPCTSCGMSESAGNHGGY